MKFQEVIDMIEEKKDTQKVLKFKKTLKNHLKKIDKEAFLARGLTYYYLVHITLSSHTLFETPECKKNYTRMCEYFLAEEKRLQENSKKAKRVTKKLTDEFNMFYKMMERCFSILQVLYAKKGFHEREYSAYEKKMDYRKKHFWFKKQFWRWFEYAFLDHSCKYGHSFLRWGITSLTFAIVLAGIYGLMDFWDPMNKVIPKAVHWYDYIYFSITTLTSLGYGDLVPASFISKLFATIEVFFGYIMLGIFITLIQKKV